MISTAKVSVVIPCYNQGRFLKEAVASVQSQTHCNWECIIVNDGSTDDTEVLALQLAAMDARILYHSQPNHGLSGARNAGLQLASGDFIQLLDADDALHPQKFERHLAAIAAADVPANRAIVAYAASLYGLHQDIYTTYPSSARQQLTSDNPVKEIILNWENKLSIAANAYFFSANIFRQHGIRFDETITTCEDIDCWIRIFQLQPVIFYSEEPLAYYRNTPDSMSKNIERVWKGYVQVMEKHMKLAEPKSSLYKWARYKKNEVLFRYKQISKMDFRYKFYFRKGLYLYYKERLLTKLNLKK